MKFPLTTNTARSMRRIFLSGLMCTGLAMNALAAGPGEYLPQGTVAIDVVAIAPPDKSVGKLALKFKKSVSKHAEWFKEYGSKHIIAGQPLPYDPRFGISEAEYQKLVNAKPVLRTIANGKLERIDTAETTEIVVHIDDVPAMKFKFSKADGSVSLPHDTLNITTPQLLDPKPTVGSDAFGDWEGLRWESAAPAEKMLRGEHSDGEVVALSLGAIPNERRGLFRMHLYELKGGAVVKKDKIEFVYPLSQ